MRWSRFLRRDLVESEMSDEIRFHLETLADDLMRRDPSSTPAEAARRARLQFGSVESHKEEARQAMGFQPLDELLADARYAFRGFRNKPGFATVAILVLALATGTNLIFFSFYSGYLLKPLPIRAPERHYQLEGKGGDGNTFRSWTEAEFLQLQAAVDRDWEGLYAERTRQAVVMQPHQAKVVISCVSVNFFPLLGIRTAIGRSFDATESRAPLVVLSDSGRRRLFANEANPIGRPLRIRNTQFTVIGVADPSFTGTSMVVPDAWIPLAFREVITFGDEQGPTTYSVAGLLQERVSVQAASAALTAAAVRLPREKDATVREMRLNEVRTFSASEEGISYLANAISLVFFTLLLIACANLASLQLARAASRSHEIGVRLSLGASRARVVRQLLTESFLLALCGTALGLIMALAANDLLHAYLFSRVAEFGIVVAPVALDWRVCAYSTVLATIAAMAFGLLPALQATSMDLTSATKREHSTFAGKLRQHRMRDLLLSGQVAASLVLLIMAGLLLRNLQRLSNVDPGYDMDRVFDLRFREKITPQFVDLLRRDPQIAAVSVTSRVPLMGVPPRSGLQIPGQTAVVQFNHVDEAYFPALGLSASRGRLFTAQDTAAESRRVVVSETTARNLWPQSDPVGKLLQVPLDSEAATPGSYEVIGVVPDVMSGLVFRGPDSTMVYFPAAVGSQYSSNILVRSRDANPPAVHNALRRYCSDHNPPTLCHTVTIRELSALQRFPLEVSSLIAVVLGGIALGLTCIGLYGVVSYSVSQRRREIGIRMAIGATSGLVVRQLLREAGRRVAWGLLVGLPFCLALSRLAASAAIQFHAFDPTAYLLVPAVLAGATLGSALFPAMRAALVDPTISLRQE